ncbi:hypothetical protein E3N88_01274 [Mikania micrantha]|uniref:Uncharacterized protein n=1 Tax=Mikania micrantha TaxID=192012 RepID=A0A5N6Q2T1_9ASTR|nr:hypothetical protein E3N88_01274 [Mikania micrantha]
MKPPATVTGDGNKSSVDNEETGDDVISGYGGDKNSCGDNGRVGDIVDDGSMQCCSGNEDDNNYDNNCGGNGYDTCISVDVVTLISAAQGAVFGVFMGTFTKDTSSTLPTAPPRVGSQWLKRLRGKEDLKTSVVAAFGSGVMFSLVSGAHGPDQVANVIASGVFFGLVQGGLFKVSEKLSSRRMKPTWTATCDSNQVQRNKEAKKDGS